MHDHHSKMFLHEIPNGSTGSPVLDTVQPSQAIQTLVEKINQDLRPQARLRSVKPHDPVEVQHLPQPWQLLGTGNYAAVFAHPDYPELVVKIYAPGRPGFEAEVEVYRRIGSHPATAPINNE